MTICTTGRGCCFGVAAMSRRTAAMASSQSRRALTAASPVWEHRKQAGKEKCSLLGKAMPVQACTGPQGSRRTRLLESTIDTQKWQNFQPSAPAAFIPGYIPVNYFCSRLSLPQSHSAVGRIKSTKNLNNPIGNRTRDIPTSTSMPQPTTPQPTRPNVHLTARVCWESFALNRP